MEPQHPGLMLDDALIDDVIRKFYIPPKPDILVAINEVCRSDEPDIQTLAQLVSQDVALSAAVLRLLNTPFFGFQSKIEDIRQAAAMLGATGIESLATGIFLKRAYAHKKACISMERFWDESQQSADIMYFLGDRLQLDHYVARERLYTIGLFFNAGIATFAIRFPDYRQVLEHANKDPSLRLVDLEEARYRTNHAIVGYILGRRWGLSDQILEIILEHPDEAFLSSASDTNQRIAWASLWLTRNIKYYLRHQSFLPEYAELSPTIFSLVGITEPDFIDVTEDAEQYLAN